MLQVKFSVQSPFLEPSTYERFLRWCLRFWGTMYQDMSLAVCGRDPEICWFKQDRNRGTWVAQSVKRLTSAQVMISQFVGLSPASGSVLTAQSLEPVSDSVSPSLSAPPLLTLCFSPAQK